MTRSDNGECWLCEEDGGGGVEDDLCGVGVTKDVEVMVLFGVPEMSGSSDLTA